MSNSQNPPSTPSGGHPPAHTVIGHPPQSGTFTPAPAPQPGGPPLDATQPYYPAPQPPQPAYPQDPGYPQQPGYPQDPGYPQQHPPQQYPQPQAPSQHPMTPVTAPSQPVPPVSPRPAPRPPSRPPRNPIVRLILWISEPSMLKGMAMGVILALVISVAFRVEAMWFVATSMLTLLITCLFGVLIGHYVFENRRKRLQRRGLEVLREAGGELPGLGERLFNLAWTRDSSQLPDLWDRLRRFRPAAEEIAGISIAAAFRVMAMSTLFAVLGGAISFAVFLTSYMQVERMDAQNALINKQIAQTGEQMEFAALAQQVDVALSIAERRQVTIRELLTVVNNDPKTNGNNDPKTGVKLSKPTANLIAVAVDQLEPYIGVSVDRNTGKNVMSEEVKSPEQEQLLRYLAAANVDFTELDLSRAFLDHADLHGIELVNVELPRVRLRHAQLFDAKLPGASLPGADLSLAVLARADLSGSNLATAILHKANLTDTNLSEANLVEADLSGAVLTRAVFKQAQLGRAILHGARLSRCDLSTADLTDADLTLADLSEATLPQIPKVRAAGFWWLGVYNPDYAAKLGLDAAAQQRNKAALERIQANPPLDAAAMAAVVQELKTVAPGAPA
ncbi:MAG: pentapeptide repeat-containing protein [Nannocystis sp.]|nr:pentapeptide repeat-containing protein [Nannocystis sp.]MBA3547784.1 pentapeptide repeat-containing protein [Nannocystis sp.]